jgi:glycosyltransferase involved in cell wall biosynthesis
MPNSEKTIRILQVFNQYLEPGGEEIWVDTMKTLGRDKVEFHELRFHSRAWRGAGAPGFLRQVRLIMDNPVARQRLRDEVNSVRPHALVFHNLIPIASFGLYDEARKLGLPVFQYIHNFRPFSPSGTLWIRNRVDDRALRGNAIPEILARSWESSWLKTAVLAFYLNRIRKDGTLDAVTRWVAISEFMRNKFIEAGVPEGKISTLRHCWSLPDAPPAGEEGSHYLFLGRLVAEKGIFTLLEAWRELGRTLGDACPKLVIAGSGPEDGKVRSLASEIGNIECCGFANGAMKDHLLQTCRGLIAPSIWWEPLGLIVYEAYAAGRPVIAARSGALTETVIHETTGFLFEAGNAASLAASICTNEKIGAARRLEMGSIGHRWLRENANPELWLEDFIALLGNTAAPAGNKTTT